MGGKGWLLRGRDLNMRGVVGMMSCLRWFWVFRFVIKGRGLQRENEIGEERKRTKCWLSPICHPGRWLLRICYW